MLHKCIECNEPAEWVRSTQFAGDHPYCDKHARLEKDFGEDDSYAYWWKIRHCPKCGSTDVSIEEHLTGEGSMEYAEWMDNTCDDCGEKWTTND